MVYEKTKNGKKMVYEKNKKMEKKMVYEKTKKMKKQKRFKWKKGQSHWGGNRYMTRFKGNGSTVE